MKRILTSYVPVVIVLMAWLSPCQPNLFGQHSLPGFTNYGNTNPGISSLTVIKTYQDHRGLIWFCTSNGANFFNGKSIQHLTYNPLDTNSMAATVVTAMQQDSKDRYWFAHIGGLTIYDPYAAVGKQFIQLYKATDKKPGLPGDQIQFLLYDGHGHMWASTIGVGLMKIDELTLEAEVVDLKLEESLKVTDGIGIFFDSADQRIYAAANTSRLIGIDIKTNEIFNFKQPIDSIIALGAYEDPIDFQVSNVFRDEEGTFWMSTRGNDLIAWNASKKYSQVWRFGIIKESGDRIFPIAEDRYKNIWFGFPLKGLFVLEKSTGRITNYLNNPNDATSLAHNTVNHIVKDRNDVMWLSTYKGVSKFDGAEQPFQYTRPYLNRSTTEDSPPLKSFYEDSLGNIWLGSEAGLLYYAKDSSSYIEIPVKGLQENNLVINAITSLSNGNLLLGTGIGLYQFDIVTHKTEPFLWKDCNVCNEKTRGAIGKFLKDTIQGKSFIWIGSQKSGLFLLNLQSKELQFAPVATDTTPGLPDNTIWDLEKDAHQKLWIATRGGLRQLISAETWELAPPVKSPGDTIGFPETEVRDICFDQHNNLYAITTKGFIIQKDGMYVFGQTVFPGINPKVHNVARDSKGNIWILTASEYIRYTPESNSYKIYDSRIANRGQFGLGAFSLTNDKKLLYRNSKQITWINPDPSFETCKIPRTYIIDFLLFDTSRMDLLAGHDIKLNSDQNNITIYFASDNYTFTELNQFRWKLEGIDKDWVTVRNRNFALYSGLPPDHYSFVVQSRNADGVWDDKGAALAFTIRPPWYLTWWFKLLAIALAIGVISYIVHERTKRLLMEQRMEIEKSMALEQERSRISKDMHDDLGSGLSAIHLMANYLRENTAEKYPEFSDDINKIQVSSEELNQRIREIIWTVNAKDDTLESTISFIQRHAHEFSESTKIPIIVIRPDEIPEISLNGLQRKHIFLATKEALNNAVKHAHPTKIQIELMPVTSPRIVMRITDDGQGFDTVNNPQAYNGNGLGNIKNRMNEIGGNADIKSSEKGTEITFTLNI